MEVVEIGKSYAVGWGTLALINAGLAQAKGRSRLLWFLASLLLGPIATLLIVITDNAKPLFLTAALQVVVLPTAAFAQCVIFEKPEDLFARADVVFVGTVVANEPTGAQGAHSIVDIATLRVEQSWKGRPARQVRVGADRPFEIPASSSARRKTNDARVRAPRQLVCEQSDGLQLPDGVR